MTPVEQEYLDAFRAMEAINKRLTDVYAEYERADQARRACWDALREPREQADERLKAAEAALVAESRARLEQADLLASDAVVVRPAEGR